MLTVRPTPTAWIQVVSDSAIPTWVMRVASP